MKVGFLICGTIALASIQGCATKSYGRQTELTQFERSSMTCRELELEAARTNGFIDQINAATAAPIDGKDVLGFLGDFGIGNAMEKQAAMDSAMKRKAALDTVRAGKGCLTPGPAALKNSP